MRQMYDRIRKTATSAGDVMFYVFNGGHTKRFHTMPTIRDNTVAAHSYGVAWLCYLLANWKPSVNLLMAALAHDTPEQVWGDIPSPAKWELGIKDNLDAGEAELLERNLCAFELTAREEFILTVADHFDGLLNCCHERALGNKYAVGAFRRYSANLETISAESELAGTVAFASIQHYVRAMWKEANDADCSVAK